MQVFYSAEACMACGQPYYLRQVRFLPSYKSKRQTPPEAPKIKPGVDIFCCGKLIGCNYTCELCQQVYCSNCFEKTDNHQQDSKMRKC